MGATPFSESAILLAAHGRGDTHREIARLLGIAERSVYYRLKVAGLTEKKRKWGEGEDRQLRSLHARGKGDCEISRLMGWSQAVVSRHRAKLGLPSNGGKVLSRLNKQHRLYLNKKRKEGVAALLLGWPQARCRRQAEVLQSLYAHGPQTTDDLARLLRCRVELVRYHVRQLRTAGLVLGGGCLGRHKPLSLAPGVVPNNVPKDCKTRRVDIRVVSVGVEA